MSSATRIPLLVVAALLIAGGLACRKPEPAPQPAPAPVQPEPAPQVDDGARRKAEAEAEARRQAEAEAARKAAAAQEAAFRAAADAALKDLHFDFDRADLREADKPILQGIADFLKAWPKAGLRVEGNCDERGTVEYNLALGERRAATAADYLTGLGVARERLTTESFGKEKPLCGEAAEACWSRNRRVHFTLR